MALQKKVRWQDRIICDPEIMVGKPTVKGPRISVELVLGLLSQSLGLEELFAGYPHRTREDAQACLAYAQALV